MDEQVVVTLVANDVGGIGGMERQLGELVRRVADAGIRFRVISRTLDLSHEDVEWIRVRTPSRPFSLALPSFVIWATWALRKHRCGVVHSTGAIVANRVDISTVHYCHAAVPRDLRGRRGSRRSRLYKANSKVGDWMSRTAEAWCFRASRLAIAVGVSPRVSLDLQRLFPHPASQVRVIPNGVDLDVFRPDRSVRGQLRQELGLPDTALVAAFVGGDWDRKGLSVIVESLADADGWHLIVIGNGDRDRFGRIAASAGVDTRVHFLGTSTAVDRYFKTADAFVLPSHYETFSLVSYEAAACGIPIVATAVGGIEDLVTDGETGYTVTRDAASVADALRKLRDEPQLRAAMGNNAREVAEQFSWENVARAYEQLYREVARSTQRPRTAAHTGA